MSSFVPTKEYLRGILLHYYFMKITAAEAHRILQQVYGEHALAEPTCREWFRHFKNGDYNIEDKERPGRPKKFEDSELEALLHEDPCQTLEELSASLNVGVTTVWDRIQKMGMIQKHGFWLPHELKPRDVERRFFVSEQLLERFKRKSFLYRIVTGDEKWIHYENPTPRKYRARRGEPVPSTSKSVPKQNIHGMKVMLCIWWDQKGVIYYELLQPGETITAERYRQQLIKLHRALNEKRPEINNRHDKVIFHHDNARPHVAVVVKNYLENIRWEILPQPPYSPDIAPSDYHLFRSMTHDLAEQKFRSYEEVKKWVDEWIESKSADFFWRGIHLLPERWAKVVASDGQYFEK